MNRFIAAAAASAALGALAADALAADAAPYRIRGTLDAIDGDLLAVTDRAGEARTVALDADTRVFAVDRATVDDIAQGRFVGITSIVSGGQRIALEVHIFEESLRGIGEGHYAWDLVEEPNMMTNANVAEVVALDENRQLTVDYTEGEEGAKTEGTQTILVPPTAAVVDLFPADRTVLAAGGHVWLMVTDTEDGGTSVIAAVAGLNGVEPPM